MPGFTSLQSLVEAIAGAVSDAQGQVEKARLDGVLSFLDDGHPRTLELKLPSMRPEAAPGELDIYAAPLMALVPHSGLRIKQVEIQFDIELGDLDDPADDKARAATTVEAGTRRTLSVNPVAGADAARRGTTAHVTMTIETLPPPEGLSRVLDELVRTQGYRAPPPKDAPSGGSGGAPPGPGPRRADEAATPVVRPPVPPADPPPVDPKSPPRPSRGVS